MPAITLGLAEIDDRLRSLQRRVNTFTACGAAAVAVSVLIAAVSALIVIEFRVPPAVYRTAAWFAVGVAVSVLAWSLHTIRGKWLDRPATARLADQRGQLTDRLTTLLDLHARPRPTRLAPMLLAQTLALGEQWRPVRIAPRRFPRTVWLIPLSLLAFGASPLVVPGPPPPQFPRSPSPQARAAPAPSDLRIREAVATEDRNSAGGTTLEDALIDPTGTRATVNAGGTPPGAGSARIGGGADTGLAHFPGRLRKTLAAGFGTEQMNDAMTLAAANQQRMNGAETHDPGNGNASDTNGRFGSQGKPRTDDVDDSPRQQGQHPGRTTAKRPNDSGDADPESAPNPSSDSQGGNPRPQDPTTGSQRSDVPNPLKPPETDTRNQSYDGTAPPAGNGSDPGALMGPNGQAGADAPAGPPRFKLTLTSFLRQADQQGMSAPHGSPTIHEKTVGIAAALNNRQRNDDIVRKAEIPTEYEDILRRVYSQRADQ